MLPRYVRDTNRIVDLQTGICFWRTVGKSGEVSLGVTSMHNPESVGVQFSGKAAVNLWAMLDNVTRNLESPDDDKAELQLY